MARLTKNLLVFSIGVWFSLLLCQPLGAQQVLEMPGEPIRIADLGLEDEVPSAIDLIGPASGSAGRNRTALVYRLRCWIDGVASCSAEDVNDPRIRAVRRFLGLGPVDQDGAVVVYFPDETRIEVMLERVRDLGPDDWDKSVYQPLVLTDTARAPGLPEVPSSPEHLESFAFEGAPAVQAALERLKQRF